MRTTDDVYDAVREISTRLARMESRLVQLMIKNGVDPYGRTKGPQPNIGEYSGGPGEGARGPNSGSGGKRSRVGSVG